MSFSGLKRPSASWTPPLLLHHAQFRLVGWMSPQYAEELGAFQLKDYLSSSPLSAALVVQSSWALCLGVESH